MDHESCFSSKFDAKATLNNDYVSENLASFSVPYFETIDDFEKHLLETNETLCAELRSLDLQNIKRTKLLTGKKRSVRAVFSYHS